MKKVDNNVLLLIIILIVLFIFPLISNIRRQYFNNINSKMGDINNDGIINSVDYVIVKRYILGFRILDNNEKIIADINYDNRVDNSDNLLIQKYILGDTSAIKSKPTISPTSTPKPVITPSPTIRPTIVPTSTPVPTSTLNSNNYTINYYGNGANSGSVSSHVCVMNGNCTIKANGFTKTGYVFVGWTTNSNGVDDRHQWTGWSGTWKYTNGQYGIASNQLNLYARWEEEGKSVLPLEYKVPSGYSVVSGKEYSSSTLKYKTISKKVDGNNNFYSLIWVKDAYNQLNSANNNYNGGQRTTILNAEINSMGYQNKGMIATNGSYTINGRCNTPAIATKGIIVNNDKYITKLPDGRSVVYGTLTLGSDNLLKTKTFDEANSAKNWLSSVGARNSWAITFYEDSNWSGANDGADRRTAICQVDTHNFVLYTGYSGIRNLIMDLHNLFGCTRVANLDGGGSTGMYYKTNNMNKIGIIYEYKRPNECCRSIADMLYFIE